MTEIYNGPWNPITGDSKPSKRVPDDQYHPRYPDVNGGSRPEYGKPVKVESKAAQAK